MKKIQLILLFAFFVNLVTADEVNVYTSRHYDSDDALYEEFTQETGIKVNIISGKGSALLQRLKAEGKNSPADIFFTVDAGNLWKVQKEGLLQQSDPKELEKIILDVISKNQDKVAQYKAGKEKLFGYFVGEVMKASKGKANPQLVNEILKKKLH